MIYTPVKQYELLLTDLDGTLLDDDHNIPRQNKRAVEAVISMGKHVVICSGRAWVSMERFEEQLSLNKPGHFGAAFNGGTVYAYVDGENNKTERRFLYDYSMQNVLSVELVNELKAMGANPMVYIGNLLLADTITDDMRRYSDRVRIPINVTKDLLAIASDVTKIIVKSGNHTMLRAAYDCLHTRYINQCNVFFSDRTLLELSHPEAHKGSAVRFLADHLYIPLSETIAVGDQENDIPMLKAAGLGVATANASPETKAAADYITEANNNQSAVCEVIERFVL